MINTKRADCHCCTCSLYVFTSSIGQAVPRYHFWPSLADFRHLLDVSSVLIGLPQHSFLISLYSLYMCTCVFHYAYKEIWLYVFFQHVNKTTFKYGVNYRIPNWTFNYSIMHVHSKIQCQNLIKLHVFDKMVGQ